MKFILREHLAPSDRKPEWMARTFDIVPKRGRYPQNWMSVDVALESPLPNHVSARLLVGTCLDRENLLHFVVDLKDLSRGKTNFLLKMAGDVRSLQLVFEPAAPTLGLRSFRITNLWRPVGMLWVVLRDLGRTIQHPSTLITLFRDGLAQFKGRGIQGVASYLRKYFLRDVVRIQDYYDLWVDNFGKLTHEDREVIKRKAAALSPAPKISVLMPVYNPDPRWLSAAVESVKAQIYPHWELCIADDCSPNPEVRNMLSRYAAEDARIKVVFRDANGHISRASNDALALCTGEFTALLDHDDELSEDALYWVAEELRQFPNADLLYSDEDKIDAGGRRFHPHFKMNWNPDLFYSVNVVTHLAVFRTALLNQIGGFRVGFEGSQDYDLVLRVVEKTQVDKIRHIPRILYHWRAIPTSTADNPAAKDYAHFAARRAIADHFRRRDVKAEVEAGYGSYHRVKYAEPAPLPKVTAIVCTRDRLELLRGIIEGLRTQTNYPNLEILIVDNQSREPETRAYFAEISQDPKVRVIKYDEPFNFSAMNNFAVEQSEGELLAFLNNDLLVIQPDWLREMVTLAVRPECGAVGARLLYPTGEIQHAGIILGIGGVAGHAHRFTDGSEGGYMSRSKLVQNFSAVTAACMVMRRSVFNEAGGFDEENLPVAFNDVDLCLKVRSLGYGITYTPYAELYHLESASRGSDVSKTNRPRFAREIEFMKKKWGEALTNDPYYNPNLTLVEENYTMAFPPRVPAPREERSH
jgi:GT2 family glycosyltransferase